MTALLFESDVESPDTRAPPLPPTPSRDYLSYSAIRQYQTCALRYYFRYIARIPETTISAAFVFGGAIHRAIERHFQNLLEGNAAPPQDELFAEYRAGWNEHALPIRFNKDDRADSFDNLAKRMPKAFTQSDLARPAGKILAVEETLRGALIPGLPEVLGRVDLILETEQELIVADWKSAPDVSVLAQR